MREFFTIAIFKIKADIRMNKTTLNSQKEKHSMLSLRRATRAHDGAKNGITISIHALLAESDVDYISGSAAACKFLSTLSLRRAPLRWCASISSRQFLSTLSLRRATTAADQALLHFQISIHALLAESDVFAPICWE